MTSEEHILAINKILEIFGQKLVHSVHKPVSQVLRDFSEFANAYHGFISKNSSPTTPLFQYNLNRAMEQIQQEASTITRACEQYLIPKIRDELNSANERLKTQYAAFQGYKLQAANPVAYFEKVYSITRFVFTPYPLISIPLRYFSLPAQYVALAHEMGHYFYWNSCPSANLRDVHENLQLVVNKALVQHGADETTRNFLLPTWRAWLEESFADICGVLLEKMDFVESTIQLAKNETGLLPNNLLDNDRDHPPYYLRPLIAIETLAWIAEQTNTPELISQVGQKRQEWEAILQEVPLDQDMITEFYDVDVALFKLLKPSVKTVVNAILAGYNEQAAWVKPDSATPQSGGFQPANLGELINRSIQPLAPTDIPPEEQLARIIQESEYNFEHLKRTIQAKLQPEANLVEALLEHSLSHQETEKPQRRNVRANNTNCNNKPTWILDNQSATIKRVKKSTCSTTNGVPLYIEA